MKKKTLRKIHGKNTKRKVKFNLKKSKKKGGAGLVIAAFGYLYYIDPKKAIKTLAGIGIFIVFMVLVYFLSAGESGSDMKLASTAINSTIILISIALLGWLGGSLVKYIK